MRFNGSVISGAAATCRVRSVLLDDLFPCRVRVG